MNVDNPTIEQLMNRIGKDARSAALVLVNASSQAKRNAILGAADAIESNSEFIIAQNQIDVTAAHNNGLSDAMIDRLKLDLGRIHSMASGLRAIASLPDPVGTVIKDWDRPNGLQIQQVRTPLGVIGVIYESRPNVTADAGALCLMSGNAVILRGGSDSLHSSNAIHDCLKTGLNSAGLPETTVQIVPVADRNAVGIMLNGINGNIDVIVPRGGKGLVGRVQQDCKVPVFAHLEGICHVYVEASSEVAMAVAVVHNAKMRRTGICGAAETLLVEEAAIETHLHPILDKLIGSGCEIRGDEKVCEAFPNAVPVSEEDWSTEYLSPVLSVKVVSDIEAAIEHIQRYSSGHTEAIISECEKSVSEFFNRIDSAILLHNASTQFADGGEFGMGAEIGIATGKMHARGPVGVEQLTSFNYRVRGTGQVRPQ